MSKNAVPGHPAQGDLEPRRLRIRCLLMLLHKGSYWFAVDRGDAKRRRSVITLEMDH
ncbi:MAG: hypothetical protein Q7T96_00035 [Methylobacter sp.]|nr:hypothetical protein [Methylobacter sp.]